jgi:hypothetical protein
MTSYIALKWRTERPKSRHKPQGPGFEFPFYCILFNLPNPSSLTMALGFTQPLTEVSTRNLPVGVKRGRRVSLTTSPPSKSRFPRKWGSTDVSTSQTYSSSTACYGDSFTFLLLYYARKNPLYLQPNANWVSTPITRQLIQPHESRSLQFRVDSARRAMMFPGITESRTFSLRLQSHICKRCTRILLEIVIMKPKQWQFTVRYAYIFKCQKSSLHSGVLHPFCCVSAAF